MNNVFVYIEIEGTEVREVSQELLTKGRKLANELGVELHAVAIGTGIKGKVEEQVLPYGVDKMFVFDAPELFPYTSAPHTDIVVNLFKEEQPQICLMGATVIGRDLGPRVSSSLTSGLTADCTQLEIGPYEDKKSGKTYENLLYQIRPAFGGNIVATIVNPDHRPQMATVRSGVMQKAVYDGACKKEVVYPEVSKYVSARRRASTACSSSPRYCTARWAEAVPPWMPDGLTTTARLARRASRCTPRCTSPAASAAKSSTSPACRIRASSSASTPTPRPPSTRLPTM